MRAIIDEKNSSIQFDEINPFYMSKCEKDLFKKSFDYYLESENCILTEKEKECAREINCLESVALSNIFIEKETCLKRKRQNGTIRFRYMYDIIIFLMEFYETLNGREGTYLVIDKDSAAIFYIIEFNTLRTNGYEIAEAFINAARRVEEIIKANSIKQEKP